MSDPYVGEIKIFAGNFAPSGWAFCDGQVMAIADYTTLYTLLGTTYGGDGITTFALPDLRGRSPVHQGQGPGLSNYTIGSKGGVESVTLTTQQLPSHSHALGAGEVGNSANPQGALLAATTAARDFRYSNGSANANLASDTLQAVGGSQSHENRSPFVAINFIISLYGIFPSQP